ncbi:bifunctional (p)ppGpp synthetase/guanosine-3',5'-bis(diphosphate) 3'-pyrophosphohydrolase [Candidatus Peregrinibacteria bacterium]|nr:bifunctional (p)ppGpp synthetase/guanosine-3',5'-bis(diphosphate) 3'-pyrophosphohydrolase [Candidatus Peregrinibacteria bacterium]
MERVKKFLDRVKKLSPSFNLKKIEMAFNMSKEIGGVDCDCSLPEAILRLKPDESSIIASCFYGCLDKIGAGEINRIKESFGDDVSNIVTNLLRLKDISYVVNIKDSETIRSLFIVMAKDMRVILIWLSAFVLLSNKIDKMPEAQRKAFAERAMSIFAPITARLGMYKMKHTLEDNAFKYLDSEEYNRIYSQLKKFGKQKMKHINEAITVLKKFFKENKIEAEITGRIKSIYSIYKKMKAKNKSSINDVFDIIALRVVLPTKYKSNIETVEHLYGLLGLIHSKWTPVANRFKDYIAIPKLNGYQSLHTTVLGIAPRFLDHPVEIQIRSAKMHEAAELGIATHWVYKEHKSKNLSEPHNAAQKAHTEWLKVLKDFKTIEDLQFGAEMDFFEDKIFALTPKGDVKDLPAGSTAIDFAYSIHTDIGHRAYAAKANGGAVPLSYELKNGDVVEIVLKPKPGPKAEWLSFVKTDAARSRIKDWLRSQKKSESFKSGKEIINKYLQRLGKSPLDDNLSVLKIYDARILSSAERKSLVEDVGSGAVIIKTFVKKLFPQPDVFPAPRIPQKPAALVAKKKKPEILDILVGGESGLPLRFAKCCSVKYGLPITGYVTKTGYIAIHDAECKSLQRNIKSRTIEASWSSEASKALKKYTVKIVIEANDRIGLLRDVTAVIADMKIDIADVVLLEKHDNFLKRAFILEVESYDFIDKIMDRLEGVYGVSKVYYSPGLRPRA